jgi:RNA polymerase sigma-70 factor, ECF subfamily
MQGETETTTPNVSGEMTALFMRFSAGDAAASAKIMPLIYDELKRVARNHVRKERSDNTLQSTALVNEAFMRLSDQGEIMINNRAHFFRLASQVMRNVLVDHARAKLAEKRGGNVHVTSLDQTAINYHEQCAKHLYLDDATRGANQVEVDFIALEDALEGLRELSPRQAQVVDLRFFGGMSIDESAAVLGISAATVKREWTMARLYLKRELTTTALPTH